MTILIFGKFLQQVKALLAPLVRANARMGLVDNNQVRTCPLKTGAAAVSLYVVQADDSKRMSIEQSLRGQESLVATVNDLMISLVII